MNMIPLVMANEPGRAQNVNRKSLGFRIVVLMSISSTRPGLSLLEESVREGENPVFLGTDPSANSVFF